MIVIAIISMLAALLLPALKSAHDKAYTAACANNLHQIQLALVMYQDDYDRCYPPCLYDGTTTMTDPAMSFMKTCPRISGGSGYVSWMWLFYPYHRNPKIYICPSAKFQGYGWTYAIATGFSGFISPAGIWSNFYGSCPGPIRQGSERYTDKKIIVMDGSAGFQGVNPVGTHPTAYDFGSSGYQDFQHNGAPNGGPNCLFADGHIAWMSGFYTNAFLDGGQRWFQPCALSMP